MEHKSWYSVSTVRRRLFGPVDLIPEYRLGLEQQLWLECLRANRTVDMMPDSLWNIRGRRGVLGLVHRGSVKATCNGLGVDTSLPLLVKK